MLALLVIQFARTPAAVRFGSDLARFAPPLQEPTYPRRTDLKEKRHFPMGHLAFIHSGENSFPQVERIWGHWLDSFPAAQTTQFSKSTLCQYETRSNSLPSSPREINPGAGSDVHRGAPRQSAAANSADSIRGNAGPVISIRSSALPTALIFHA